MPVKRGFRTCEVVKLTGLTRRQLDYWDRAGMFKPSLAQAEGRGSARFYSFLDVVQLRAVKKLLDAGFPARRLRGCLAFIQEHLKEENFGSLSLVTDGREIFALTGDPDVALTLSQGGQRAWVVWLKEGELVSREGAASSHADTADEAEERKERGGLKASPRS